MGSAQLTYVDTRAPVGTAMLTNLDDRPGGAEAGPILDKAELVAALQPALKEADTFADERGVHLDAIASAQGFARIALIDDAVEAFLVNEADKKQFLQLASRAARLFKAILPDSLANQVAPIAVLVSYLAAKIHAEIDPPDISAVMGEVEVILTAPQVNCDSRPVRSGLEGLLSRLVPADAGVSDAASPNDFLDDHARRPGRMRK